MPQTQISITGMGIISSLGKSPGMIAKKLLSGESGVKKFSFQPGSPELTAARVLSAVKMATENRWPISRATALALQATREVLPGNGEPPESEPRLGVIHATTYGNLRSLVDYQADLRKYGMHRASPMQFPNTILHAAASFLSVCTGAAAFNITLSSENLSGVDAVETAGQLISAGAADKVLVVTSEDISNELIPVLATCDEIDWKAPDPFGEKRAGYVPGEAAAAILVEPAEEARKAKKKVYGLLRGCSGITQGRDNASSCEQTMQAALADAGLVPEDIGCVIASANGSTGDGEEANAIANVFGKQVPVTTVKAAFGECGASAALLSLAAAIFCAEKGYYPPTTGRSKYDRKLKPINLLRRKSKISSPYVLINAFNKTARCSQVWELPLAKGRA